MNHSSTNLVYMALGAVLIALCSWITVPAAVPFTMQTFAVFFILSALGGKRGTVTILVYIALGAAGVPVFSQFGAGPGVLLGNTGGYILGFLAMGLTYWGITALLGETRKIRFLGLLLGLVQGFVVHHIELNVLATVGQVGPDQGAQLMDVVLAAQRSGVELHVQQHGVEGVLVDLHGAAQ